MGTVGSDVNVGRLPAIGGIDVVGAGRGHADEIGQSPHQDVVARPRPRLIEIELVILVDVGVVEIVEGLPALSGPDAVGLQRPVEVLRAIDVPGVAHVVVVAGVAGGGESIVATAGVLHDLDQRLELAIERLGRQAGRGIAAPGQRAGHRGVQRHIHPEIDLAEGEGLEVGALAPLDIDDLDELAGLHQIGRRGRGADPEILAGVAERLGQEGISRPPCVPAPDEQLDRRRGVLPGRIHPAPDGAEQHEAVAGHRKFGSRAGGCLGTENPQTAGQGDIDAAPGKRPPRALGSLAAVFQRRLQAVARSRRLGTERTGIEEARAGNMKELDGLPAFHILQLEPVARRHGDHKGAAAGHDVALATGRQRRTARSDDGARPRYKRTWKGPRRVEQGILLHSGSAAGPPV